MEAALACWRRNCFTYSGACVVFSTVFGRTEFPSQDGVCDLNKQLKVSVLTNSDGFNPSTFNSQWSWAPLHLGWSFPI